MSQITAAVMPAILPERRCACPRQVVSCIRRRHASRSRSAARPRRSAASPGPGSCAPRPSTRRAPSAGSPHRSAAQTPVFQSVPARHLRPRPDADHGRLHRLPHVDVRVAGDEHVRAGHRGGGPGLLACRRRGGRRARRAGGAGPGPNSATAAARSSIPCIGSTTTPSTRRSWPHTRSTSSASCRPSTQIRAARAVRAVMSRDLHRARTPSGPGPPGARAGTHERGRRALDQERGRAQREHPPAAVAVLEGDLARRRRATTAPQNPLRRVLDHEPGLGGHLRDLPCASTRVPSAANAPR